MANQFQPILQQANVSPFITPGVSDPSAAILIKSLGGMAIDAYTGYQQAGLEEALQAEAEGFFNQNQQFEEGKQAGVDAAATRTTVDAMWNNFDAKIEDVNVLEQQFQRKLGTYASAMKQGRMTPDELYSRIISTTKEHVSRNPWLQKELLQAADSYMEASGLGSYIKEAQKSSKEQADLQKELLKHQMMRASDYGINLDNPAWSSQLQEVDASKEKLDVMSKQLAHVKDMMPEEAGKWLEQNQGVYQGMWAKMQDAVLLETTKLQANGQPLPWDAQKLNIKMQARNFAQGMRDSITTNNPRLLTEPVIADYLKFVDAQTKDFVDSVDGYKSGEYLLKDLQTRYATTEARQKMAIQGQVNLPAFDAFSKYWGALSDQDKLRISEKNPNLYSNLAAGANLMSGMAMNNLSAIPGVVDTLLTSGNNGSDVSKDLGNSIRGISKTIADPDIVKNPTDKLKTLHGIHVQFADPKNLDSLRQLNDQDRRMATGLVMEYMDTVRLNAEKRMADLASSGINLEWTQLPNGSLTLQYAKDSVRDDKKLAEMNSMFADPMTTAIKSFSHLHGSTNYQQDFKEMFVGSTTNPQDTLFATKPGQESMKKNLEEAYSMKLQAGDRDGAERILEQMRFLEDTKKRSQSEEELKKRIGDLPVETPTAYHFKMIEEEIAKATNPMIKAILIEEHNKMKALIPPAMNKGNKGKITGSATPLKGKTFNERLKDAEKKMKELGPIPGQYK